MKNIITASTLLGLCLVGSMSVAGQPHSAELISQLTHKRYAVREAASYALIKLGIRVVPDLINTCASGDVETNYRALLILERIGLEGDPEDLKFVIQGLELLGRAGHPAMLSRSKKLSSHYREYKTQFALKELRKLGAQVQEFDSNSGFVPGLDVGARGVVMIGGRIVPWVAPHDVNGANAQPEGKPDKKVKTESELDEAEFRIEVEKLRRQIEGKQAALMFPGEILCLYLLQEEGQAVEEKIQIFEEEVRVIEDLRVMLPADFDLRQRFGGATGQGNSKSRIVTINRNWKGGTEGFKLLNQVNNLYQLRIDGLELSSATFEAISQVESLGALQISASLFEPRDIFAFVKAHPNTTVTVVGKAMLGVYPEQPTGGNEGCTLSRIAEGSGAAKAGLLAGDTIIEVDGYKVIDFPTLTYTVAGRDVDKVLKVKVLRDGAEKRFEVTLGSRAVIEP